MGNSTRRYAMVCAEPDHQERRMIVELFILAILVLLAGTIISPSRCIAGPEIRTDDLVLLYNHRIPPAGESFSSDPALR